MYEKGGETAPTSSVPDLQSNDSVGVEVHCLCIHKQLSSEAKAHTNTSYLREEVDADRRLVGAAEVVVHEPGDNAGLADRFVAEEDELVFGRVTTRHTSPPVAHPREKLLLAGAVQTELMGL